MRSKADAYEVLEFVCREYGVPRVMVSDNAKEETLGNWGRIAKQNLLKQRTTEPHSGWQNRCETEIREFRKHYQRITSLNKCPEAFWDFAIKYIISVVQYDNFWYVARHMTDRPLKQLLVKPLIRPNTWILIFMNLSNTATQIRTSTIPLNWVDG
jgi:hypothetical protein